MVLKHTLTALARTTVGYEPSMLESEPAENGEGEATEEDERAEGAAEEEYTDEFSDLMGAPSMATCIDGPAFVSVLAMAID